ncbi:MAG TPA: hypothetical protein VL485_11730 [Ktedonobacteraceae bacterium]|nr:hypothetical protein [Ktedonobacteraceae bacterium]
MKRKRILACIVALAILCASASVALGAFVAPGTAYASPATPTATDFTINAGSDPWGTAFDSSGNVWVAVPGCDPSPYCSTGTPPGRLDVYNPQASSWVTSHQLPAGFGQPLFVAFDKQGRAWFPMPMTNSLGMYNPSNNTYSQWVVPTAGSGPWGVAIDSKGVVWFTEHYSNKIGSFNPSTQTFTEIATPASNSVPYGITVDSSDNVWFTENSDAVALIAEYTTGGVLKEYKIRNGSTSGVTPHMITIDQNGNVWWSEGWATAVGRLVLSQATPGTNNGVTEYPYQSACGSCSHTSGITADANGYIWFTDSLQGIYGYLNSNGSGSLSIVNTPSSGGHPHDGLNAGPNNVIWFTEEFANKLGKITGGPSGGGTGGTPTPVPSPSPTSTPPANGAVLAQDTFHRTDQSFWGTASDGQTWGADANVASAFSVANNTGLVTNAGLSYSAVLGPSITDSDVVLTGSISNFANNNFGPVLRFTDGNNWYKAYIDGINLVIQKKVNGTATIIQTAPFAATASTQYALRFRAVGTTLSAKVWATAGSEPSGWTTTITDSSLTGGQDGVRVLSSGATTTINSFVATSLTSGGSTPTPTPTTPPTPTITPSPTSTPPANGATLAQDTFHRANQSFWGTASDGQTWGADANAASAFSVANNTGLVTNADLSYSAVLGPSIADSDALLTGSINNFTNNNFGPIVRFTDGNNWYKAYIDGVSLVIQKKVNGVATIIQTVPFAATASTQYALRFRAVGTTLSAKVWATAGSEPSGWTATVTDSSLTSGQDGVRVLSSGAVTTINSFVATSLTGGGTTTPTPTPTSTSPTPTPTSAAPTPTPTSAAPTPTSTPPANGATLAQDTFHRANQSFWGTASDGQTWGADANATTAFSVANNTGLVTNASLSYSAVLGPAIADSDALLTGSINNFTNNNFGPVLRFTDGNNWYKAYIDGVSLVIQKKVNGVTTVIKTVPFAATASTQYALRFRAVGTTLSAKVWATAGSEPSSWTTTITDSSLTSGQDGVRVLASGATITINSFVATSLSSGGTTTPAAATPTPRPTATPSPTPTPRPTATPGATPTPRPTATPSPTPQPTPTSGVTPTPTTASTPTPTPTP